MPKATSKEKRQAIKDAITAGMKLADISVRLHTSAMTIIKIKREMGLPIQSDSYRTKAGKAVAPTVMHHREIPPHSYLERVKELEKRGFAATTEDITSEDEQPAPAQAYTPQEYFEAIATGLRERDAENAALRHEVTGLRSMAARLEADNLRLVSDLNQCKLQMANWSGPATLPSMSLGNGG
jgi:hypothetical protein